jgi:hypothetical protein
MRAPHTATAARISVPSCTNGAAACACSRPSLTRRYGLSKVVRRAKVLAVEPVFAADYDAAAHLQAGRPPRMPTAFRLALDDGSTLSAKRVVAAVCSSHAAACARDVVCWTSVALIVACCTLHIMWWSGPPLIADAVHSHAQWAARSRALERARAHIVPKGDRKVCAWHRNARVCCRSGRTTRRASHRGRMRTSCDSPATWYADRSLASCAAAVLGCAECPQCAPALRQP